MIIKSNKLHFSKFNNIRFTNNNFNDNKVI